MKIAIFQIQFTGMVTTIPSCRRCKKLKSLCKCGRPLFDGKNEKLVLSKLDEAFAHCLSDKDAALYAGISPSAYYRLIEKQPEIRERKERLRLEVNMALRKVVIEHAKKDPQMALKLLERMQPLEFAPTAVRPPPAPEIKDPRPLSEQAKEQLMRFNPHPETWRTTQ
ncbi:hypothetical protein IPG41_06980 [Candidatus Peregrinibacteria bacterium]|nr:MAG: hypothetical protein IPG41_06980 [Candidatus Peregrinibacteria bacterium]